MSFSDEDDESAAMAAAMGFSSFGASVPAKKKRKFNPATDAFVEGQELAGLDRGGKKGKGSGGNTVALGKVRTFGSGAGIEKELNEAEIDLDDDDDEGGVNVGQQQGREGKINNDSLREGELDDDANDGPNYVDTSQPPPAAVQAEAQTDEDKEMQARIDAILASVPPPPPGSSEEALRGQTHGAPGKHPPYNLPQRPPLPPVGGLGYTDTAFMQGRLGPPPPGVNPSGSDSASVTSSRGRGGGRGGGGRGGQERNERWYEGYYDPGFNENPWDMLEKEKGLQPVGSWLERGH